MAELGVGSMLGSFFAYPPFIELPKEKEVKPVTWSAMLSNPFPSAFLSFAMRRPGKVDGKGVVVLDLDQLARPKVVEHDNSLSRFDHDQGDNLTPPPELIKDILIASSDGITLNVLDFVKLRTARIERHSEVSPKVHYMAFQNQNCLHRHCPHSQGYWRWQRSTFELCQGFI